MVGINFMKSCISVDIGGSSVKIGIFCPSPHFHSQKIMEIPHPDSWSEFPEYLLSSIYPMEIEQIAVSCAGDIDSVSGVVRRSTVTRWHNYSLGLELDLLIKPSRKTVVINDADAHLMGNRNGPGPLICIALGTSLGFSVANQNGDLARSAEGFNLDVGDLKLNTKATVKEAWWALGLPGLQELISLKGVTRGPIHFGHRLGSLILRLQADTKYKGIPVVLSGGVITAYPSHILYGCLREIDDAELMDNIKVTLSPYPKAAALVGAMRAAGYEMMGNCLSA